MTKMTPVEQDPQPLVFCKRPLPSGTRSPSSRATSFGEGTSDREKMRTPSLCQSDDTSASQSDSPVTQHVSLLSAALLADGIQQRGLRSPSGGILRKNAAGTSDAVATKTAIVEAPPAVDERRVPRPSFKTHFAEPVKPERRRVSLPPAPMEASSSGSPEHHSDGPVTFLSRSAGLALRPCLIRQSSSDMSRLWTSSPAQSVIADADADATLLAESPPPLTNPVDGVDEHDDVCVSPHTTIHHLPADSVSRKLKFAAASPTDAIGRHDRDHTSHTAEAAAMLTSRRSSATASSDDDRPYVDTIELRGAAKRAMFNIPPAGLTRLNKPAARSPRLTRGPAGVVASCDYFSERADVPTPTRRTRLASPRPGAPKLKLHDAGSDSDDEAEEYDQDSDAETEQDEESEDESEEEEDEEDEDDDDEDEDEDEDDMSSLNPTDSTPSVAETDGDAASIIAPSFDSRTLAHPMSFLPDTFDTSETPSLSCSLDSIDYAAASSVEPPAEPMLQPGRRRHHLTWQQLRLALPGRRRASAAVIEGEMARPGRSRSSTAEGLSRPALLQTVTAPATASGHEETPTASPRFPQSTSMARRLSAGATTRGSPSLPACDAQTATRFASSPPETKAHPVVQQVLRHLDSPAPTSSSVTFMDLGSALLTGGTHDSDLRAGGRPRAGRVFSEQPPPPPSSSTRPLLRSAASTATHVRSRSEETRVQLRPHSPSRPSSALQRRAPSPSPHPQAHYSSDTPSHRAHLRPIRILSHHAPADRDGTAPPPARRQRPRTVGHEEAAPERRFFVERLGGVAAHTRIRRRSMEFAWGRCRLGAGAGTGAQSTTQNHSPDPAPSHSP